MAIKFEKIQAGMKLYDHHKDGRGKMGEWTVHIESVNANERSAMVIWNSNPAEWWSERRLKKLFTWSLYKRQFDERMKAEAEAKAKRENTSLEGY